VITINDADVDVALSDGSLVPGMHRRRLVTLTDGKHVMTLEWPTGFRPPRIEEQLAVDVELPDEADTVAHQVSIRYQPDAGYVAHCPLCGLSWSGDTSCVVSDLVNDHHTDIGVRVLIIRPTS
jgi:hypothetical protein